MPALCSGLLCLLDQCPGNLVKEGGVVKGRRPNLGKTFFPRHRPLHCVCLELYARDFRYAVIVVLFARSFLNGFESFGIAFEREEEAGAQPVVPGVLWIGAAAFY